VKKPARIALARVATALAAVALAAPVGGARAQEHDESDVRPSEAPASSRDALATPRGSAPSPGEPASPAPRLLDDLRLGLEESGLGDGVWLTTGVFAGDVHASAPDSLTMGSFDLGLRLAISEDARASLDWGFAVADARVRGAYVGTSTNEPFVA